MDIVAVVYFFLTSLFLGITIIEMFKIRFFLGLKLVSGCLFGLSLLSQIIFWQSWIIPFETREIILTNSLLTVICAWWWIKKSKKIRLEKVQSKQLLSWLMWMGFWLGLFGVIWSRMLRLEPNGLYAGWVNIWGDWAAHLTYTNSFALSNNFPPIMPILAETKFGYPFMADFVSAILFKLGGNLYTVMLFSSFILSFLLVMMLVFFGQEIGKKPRVGKLTAWLFLFNGGLGFWWWFKDIKKLGIFEVFNNLPMEYTHLEKIANIEWINVITSQVVPQRGFLLGFPLAILVYLFFWRYWTLKDKKNLVMAGGVTALLPLIHAHSVAIILVVAGGLIGLESLENKSPIKTLKKWMAFFIPVGLLVLPQMAYFYFGSLKSEGFIHWLPGWLATKRGDNVIWFWIKNLGLMFIWIILGLKTASKKLLLFSLPFWMVFLTANLWLFQPWEWDNTKFFIHWYLIGCVLAAILIDKLLRQKKLIVKVMVLILLEVTVLSGILDVWRLTQYKYRKIRFFTNEQLDLARWVKINTEPKAVFLTADNHDHWLPVLTGRQTLAGYKGWLWTYGINFSTQEEAVNSIFAHDLQAESNLDRYRVKYIVLGPMEKELKIEIDEKYFDQNFPIVYQTKLTKIYSVID